MYRLHRKKGAKKDPFIDARVNMQVEALPCSLRRHDETRGKTKAHVARKVDREKLFRLNKRSKAVLMALVYMPKIREEFLLFKDRTTLGLPRKGEIR